MHDGVAFGVNAAAMAAAICAVYFLTLLLFADRQAAAFSALVLALVPQQIVWSATAAAEPSASAAAAGGAAAAAYYLRRGSPAALAAMAVAAAYVIQFRPESILILPVMAWIAWPRLWPELERPRGWWAAVLFLWLAAVPAAHLFAVRHAGWGTDAPRFGAAYILPNLRVNGRFFLADWRFPVLFTAFALGGATARRTGFEQAAMALYFLLFFGVDLAFYAGSYDYGADVRVLADDVPAAGGPGGPRHREARSKRGARSPARKGVRPNFRGARVLVFALRPRGPRNHRGGMGGTGGRPVCQGRREAAAPRVVRALAGSRDVSGLGDQRGPDVAGRGQSRYARWLASRFAGGLYVHWNFWCNTQDPVQPAICRQALALGETTLVAETRERDQRFALYKLTLPAP